MVSRRRLCFCLCFLIFIKSFFLMASSGGLGPDSPHFKWHFSFKRVVFFHLPDAQKAVKRCLLHKALEDPGSLIELFQQVLLLKKAGGMNLKNIQTKVKWIDEDKDQNYKNKTTCQDQEVKFHKIMITGSVPRKGRGRIVFREVQFSCGFSKTSLKCSYHEAGEEKDLLLKVSFFPILRLEQCQKEMGFKENIFLRVYFTHLKKEFDFLSNHLEKVMLRVKNEKNSHKSKWKDQGVAFDTSRYLECVQDELSQKNRSLKKRKIRVKSKRTYNRLHNST